MFAIKSKTKASDEVKKIEPKKKILYTILIVEKRPKNDGFLFYLQIVWRLYVCSFCERSK